MNIVDKATQTQLTNIEKRTGKTLAQLFELVRASGLGKFSEIREKLNTTWVLDLVTRQCWHGFA